MLTNRQVLHRYPDHWFTRDEPDGRYLVPLCGGPGYRVEDEADARAMCEAKGWTYVGDMAAANRLRNPVELILMDRGRE